MEEGPQYRLGKVDARSNVENVTAEKFNGWFQYVKGKSMMVRKLMI